MTYLFGDSSPSNLEIDYIEFLREALEFSVAVLGAHERMMQGAARAVEVKREGDAEVNRLESLGAVVARAVEGFDIGADTSVTANCAQSLLRGAAETVRSAIDRVHGASAADTGRIEEEARRDRERCVEALGTFLKRHDLPKMSSELRLQQEGGSGYAARLYLRALDNVQAVIDLEIAPSHLFGSVVRVDKLAERLEVHAPETGGWLRKEVKLRPQRLDKEFVTAVVTNGKETMIQLRTAADGTGVGFDLRVPEDGVRVSLRRVGESNGEAPPFDLDETDSSKIRELKDKIVAATVELRGARRGLVEAALGDKPLAEARDPKALVERLVAEMAPVVREIAKRSLAPTELVLKRQTGDGRREEIFVSRRDLQMKLRGLGPATRAVFGPLELGEPPADEEPPTLKKIDKDAKSAPLPLTEKKRPAPLFAEALAVDKIAADKAPADKAPADKAPIGKVVVEKLAAPDKPADKAVAQADTIQPAPAAEMAAADKPADKAPAAKSAAAASPATSGKSEPAVRLDDSLDRLIVSEETRKP
ncbi:MAG TPA: hypothetical protein VN947_09205 [Polyangia bacterium]|nr:hypothetical protein [Polyangia bacterium]